MAVKMQPTSEIKLHLGIDPNGAVQRKFQSLCNRHMAKYVPGGEGGEIEKYKDLSDPTKIIYEHPGAHYQYESKLYVMDNGKGAYYSPTYGFWSAKGKKKHDSGRMLKHNIGGPHWDKQMVSAEMGDLVKELQAYIDRGA